mmetsp:Transcript_11344/g.28752  ORF Transcript_11344/g.28752 Transcript_11344/m.28752 type:complete len:92 (-) Transcript_11344:397-672(-)
MLNKSAMKLTVLALIGIAMAAAATALSPSLGDTYMPGYIPDQFGIFPELPGSNPSMPYPIYPSPYYYYTQPYYGYYTTMPVDSDISDELLG